MKSSIHAKLAAICGELTGITKTGMNVAHRYKYAEAAEIANVIRPLFAKHGLTLTPTEIVVIDAHTEDRGSDKVGMNHLMLRYRWTIGDGETGDTLAIESLGAGFDAGDKAAYKAATGAFKYALLTSLIVSGEDDAENESKASGEREPGTDSSVGPTPREPKNAPAAKAVVPEAKFITDAMRAKLFASAHRSGLNDAQVKALMALTTQKSSTHELTYADFDRLLIAIKDPENEAHRAVADIEKEARGDPGGTAV